DRQVGVIADEDVHAACPARHLHDLATRRTVGGDGNGADVREHDHHLRSASTERACLGVHRRHRRGELGIAGTAHPDHARRGGGVWGLPMPTTPTLIPFSVTTTDGGTSRVPSAATMLAATYGKRA